jgi:hypothetical protein
MPFFSAFSASLRDIGFFGPLKKQISRREWDEKVGLHGMR